MPIDSKLPAQLAKTFVTDSIQKQLIEDKTASKTQLCLWHRNGSKKHEGNFGPDFECLDCMKEIKKGRCLIDIEKFDLDMFYYFRSFWSKVDIKGPDECWPWLGSKRPSKYETIAYMVSPFHKAKTHSAARVAFWLSRGYTGKLRITHKEGCHYTCCNPLHLKIMGVQLENPKTISAISLELKGKTIYDHAKACIKE